MIDTSINHQDDIPGLTPKEMSEYRGVINPSETIDPRTRPQALQAQAKEFQKAIKETKARIKEFKEKKKLENDDDLENFDEYNRLKERLNGLEKALDDTLAQKQREEARNEQEEDVSRLQRFKEWAKENIAGLSALSISIAGIITTIIVGARKAIIQGAQAASKFGKAVDNLAKKLWPVLGPLLNLVAQAISWGAKGLAWLASNLWVLALAFAWFIYDQYKQKRNET